jgi:hypothetical protein
VVLSLSKSSLDSEWKSHCQCCGVASQWPRACFSRCPLATKHCRRYDLHTHQWLRDGLQGVGQGVLVRSAKTNSYQMRANLTAIHILNSENPTHAAGSRARTGTLSLSLSRERTPSGGCTSRLPVRTDCISSSSKPGNAAELLNRTTKIRTIKTRHWQVAKTFTTLLQSVRAT